MSKIHASLFKLLTQVAPDAPSLSVLAAPADPQARAEMVALAKREKCLPNLFEVWRTAGTLSAAEAAQHRVMQAKQASGVAVAKALPEEAILLKGASMQRYYPGEIVRFSVDVDVVIRDFSDTTAIHEALTPLGYLIQGGSQFWVPPNGPLNAAFASYRYWTAEQGHDAVSVEVQVGGFPLDDTRLLGHEALKVGASPVDGHRCRGLSPTRQLLLILVDFGIRAEPITVRHVADIHHLLRQAADLIDWRDIAAQTDALGLRRGLGKFAQALRGMALEPLIELGPMQALVDDSVARASDAGSAPRRDWHQHAAAWLKSTFGRYPGRRGNDLAGRLGRSRMLVSMALRGGQRAVAVLISSNGSRYPVLMRIGRHLYLGTGAGLFLLSLVDLDEERRRAHFDEVRNRRNVAVLGKWERSAC